MKKSTMLLSLLVSAMVATSCQKSGEETTGSSTTELPIDKVYVSIDLSNTSSATRADGDKGDATEEESTISEVTLLTFDDAHNFIAARSEGTISGTVYTCAVSSDVSGFVAIVNPTDEVKAAMLTITSSNAYNRLSDVFAFSIDDVAEDGNFMMVSAGVLNDGTDVTGAITFYEGSLSTEESDPTPISINVDRLVSKFQYTEGSGLSSNAAGTVTIEGVKLNATNKTSYVYSEISLDDLTGDNVYRTDPNMALGADDLDQLNWLANKQDEGNFWNSGCEYVLENTANNSYYNYNNLTQAVVKATFTPVDGNGYLVEAGVSWFAINITGKGTTNMTFNDVVSFYSGTYTYLNENSVYVQVGVTRDTQDAMDIQLNHILGTDGRTWDDGLTLAELDAISYGGYMAATVPSDDSTDPDKNYIVQYYQNGLNYYDVFIQHDDAIEIGHLGRWGMVRNNSYTLNINSILAAGLPYIPDPNDPAIVDPNNPDPEDPEPADELDAYIEATIVVNPWVTWSQDVDLD